MSLQIQWGLIIERERINKSMSFPWDVFSWSSLHWAWIWPDLFTGKLGLGAHVEASVKVQLGLSPWLGLEWEKVVCNQLESTVLASTGLHQPNLTLPDLNIACYSQIIHWDLSYKSLRKSLKFKILVLAKGMTVYITDKSYGWSKKLNHNLPLMWQCHSFQ